MAAFRPPKITVDVNEQKEISYWDYEGLVPSVNSLRLGIILYAETLFKSKVEFHVGC